MNHESFTHAGYRVEVHQDSDAQAPENDDEVFIVTTSNRHFVVKHEGFTLDDIRDGKHKRKYHVFPVYAYIHSGVALSLGAFSDPWDSGQIGYILASKSSFGLATAADAAGKWPARDACKGTLEAWNQYLSGDVWGYRVIDPDGDEVDSCWGFYGLDYAITEAKSAADASRKHEQAEASKVARMMHV